MPKSPSSHKNDTKHTFSNCYSITIRTGNGIFLGSNSVSLIKEHIERIAKYHVLTIELDDNAAHIQGGIFLETPIRQDQLRAKLLTYTMQLFHEMQDYHELLTTTKQLDNVKKHALVVKQHNDFDILVNYCLKDPTNILSTNLTDKQFDKFYCKQHYNFRCHKCPDDLKIQQYHDELVLAYHKKKFFGYSSF